MKKRIIGLALVIAVVLSLCASAGATAKHSVSSTFVEYTGIHKVSSRIGNPKSIKLAVDVALWTESDGTYSTNAAKVKLSIDSETILKPYTITPSEFTLSDTKNTSGVAMLVGDIAATGTLTVTAQLVDAEGKACTGTSASGTATIVFDNDNAADTPASNFPAAGNLVGPYVDVPHHEEDDKNPLYDTVADPDSTKWNGINPTFGVSATGASDKPKVATSKLVFTKAGADAKALTSGVSDDFTIEIQGPLVATSTSPDTVYDLSQPHALIDVYVAGKDAKKLYGTDGTKDIQLNSKDIKAYAIPFRVISWDVKKGGTDRKPLEITTLTIAYNGAHVAYKGFPLTISAINSKAGNKPVTKTYKIDINGRSTPQWVDEGGKIGDPYNAEDAGVWTKKNAADVTVCFTDGESISKYFTVSADAPYTVEDKGNKADSGITVSSVPPTLNRWGEVTYPGYVIVAGAFTAKDEKDELKEHKAAITITAAGSVKKTSAKANVIGKVSPYFDKSKWGGDYMPTKRVEAGKVPSVKFAAKGSKTITYEIEDKYQDALEKVGLSFDLKKGAVVALGDKDNIVATISDDEFQSIDIVVTATNGSGADATAMAQVAVTGGKPTLTKASQKMTLDRTDYKKDDLIVVSADVSKKAVPASDTGNKVKYSLENKAKGQDTTPDTNALKAIGLELVAEDDAALSADMAGQYRNMGVFRVLEGGLKATKSTKANLLLNNFGASNKGSVTFTINDPKPVISGDNTLKLATASKDATGTITLSLKENPTDGSKTKWSITGTKPAGDWGAKLTAASDGNSATFTVKLKKDLTAGASTTAKIVAENANSNYKSEEFEIAITAGSASTGGDTEETTSSRRVNISAIVDVDAKAEAEAEEEAAEEAKLTFGAPRSAADLTAGQQAFLQSKGYTVIAVLPEVTSDKDGQAEIAVELAEDAPEGAKLVYIPFPKNAEETDDDKIADFYDEEGAAIETVPAEKNITVAPWLRAGVTYQPVIAAEDK